MPTWGGLSASRGCAPNTSQSEQRRGNVRFRGARGRRTALFFFQVVPHGPGGPPPRDENDLFSPQSHMALAGHPRAMKMAIFTPVPHGPGGPPPRDENDLFSHQGPPRPGATSGHEKGGSQRSRRGLFSGEGRAVLSCEMAAQGCKLSPKELCKKGSWALSMRPVSLSSPGMGETTIGVVPTSRSATFALPLAGLALQPCKPRDRHHRECL